MIERLVIVQSGFLGDAVLASGLVRGLAAVAPRVEIGLVVRAEFGELFDGHPAVRRVHRFDKRSRGGTAALIEELRGGGYDTALVPHRSFRSAYAVWRAGIGRRVGFRQSDAPLLLTDRVEYDISMHETARNAMLLERVGLKVSPQKRGGWLVADRLLTARMREKFGGEGSIMVMAPGSVWPTKRWTPEGYAGVARQLRERGHRVLLVGSRGERKLCETVARLATLKPEDVLCGELNLAELLALIAVAERVITNDSAPLHLAESVGTPVTAVFGPTVPEFGFGPLAEGSHLVQIEGLPCRPCRIHGSEHCPIGTHECMRSIGVEQVMGGIGDLRLTIYD